MIGNTVRQFRSAGDILAFITHIQNKALEAQRVFRDRFRHFKGLRSGLAQKSSCQITCIWPPPCLCKWLKSFLSNRFFEVEVDGKSSSFFNTNAGVPQGSVISPRLIIIYINDLFNLPSIPTHCYADDSTLHKAQSLQNVRANIASSINLAVLSKKEGKCFEFV